MSEPKRDIKFRQLMLYWREQISVIGLIIAFTSCVMSVVVVPEVRRMMGIGAPLTATPTPVPQTLPTQVAALRTEVASLQQELSTLSKAMTSHSSADVGMLRGDLESLDDRLSIIEQAIVDNPSRAIALTLLSRDMENLQATYESDLEATRKEFERIYDLTKWLVGLLFTMNLGLLTLAIGNFLKRPKTPEERAEQKEATEQKEGPKTD